MVILADEWSMVNFQLSMVNMDTTEKELARRWVQTWQDAGEALKKIKRQELRNYDYDKNLPIIDAMLQWAYEHRATRLTSGLVEQQYWFMKMREKLLEQQAQEEAGVDVTKADTRTG